MSRAGFMVSARNEETGWRISVAQGEFEALRGRGLGSALLLAYLRDMLAVGYG
jgi:hypothetical protein